MHPHRHDDEQRPRGGHGLARVADLYDHRTGTRRSLFIITPVQDADTNDESVTLTLSGDELTMQDGHGDQVRDDDRDLVLTPSAVTVTEGGTATFTVSLASESLPGRDTTTVAVVEQGTRGRRR